MPPTTDLKQVLRNVPLLGTWSVVVFEPQQPRVHFVFHCPARAVFRDAQRSCVLVAESLNSKEREVVVRSMELQYFQDGQAIIQQGDLGDGFFVVMQGHASARKQSTMGGHPVELEVLRYNPGDYFGELALLYNRVRSLPSESSGVLDLLRHNSCVRTDHASA